jgi:excisionase family DNA binding protein
MPAARFAMTEERVARTGGARHRRPSGSEMQAASLGQDRGRRHRGDQTGFSTIAEIAERLHVNARTVRRWIKENKLVVHRVGSVVRISERDLQVFLALHREG